MRILLQCTSAEQQKDGKFLLRFDALKVAGGQGGRVLVVSDMPAVPGQMYAVMLRGMFCSPTEGGAPRQCVNDLISANFGPETLGSVTYEQEAQFLKAQGVDVE